MRQRRLQNIYFWRGLWIWPPWMICAPPFNHKLKKFCIYRGFSEIVFFRKPPKRTEEIRIGQGKGYYMEHCGSGTPQTVNKFKMAERRMKFKETQYLLDEAHHCSVLVFPLQKLLCWKFRNFLLQNKALVYLLFSTLIQLSQEEEAYSSPLCLPTSHSENTITSKNVSVKWRKIKNWEPAKQHFIISAEDVHWQWTHLNTNKSEGADEIHPKILASLASFLATPLAKLYNNSIATGKIPVEWILVYFAYTLCNRRKLPTELAKWVCTEHIVVLNLV